VIGIKTGTTTPAGGCLLFAATDKVDGKTYTVYGVLLGVHLAPYSANAKKFSKALIIAARKELREVTLLKKGRALVSVTKPDGTVHTYGVKKALTAAGWSGLPYTLSLPGGLRAGETPRTIVVKSGSRTLKVALAPLS
jgi:D-alanyl-D-alanine carboxypeptidase